MTWEEILKYKPIIDRIAYKYAGDQDLAEDTISETILRLKEDTNLDTSKFNPKSKDAAIRNTIRNKVIKILKSRKVGRWTFDSLDTLLDAGLQIDEEGVADFFVTKPSKIPDMDGRYHDEGDQSDWIREGE